MNLHVARTRPWERGVDRKIFSYIIVRNVSGEYSQAEIKNWNILYMCEPEPQSKTVAT